MSPSLRGIRFDSFQMNLREYELFKNGRKIKLQEQPFRILQAMALKPKEPILREELYPLLPSHGDYDLKHGLENAVLRIRRALGDSSENPRFIETLRGRGYRFLKDVELVPHGHSNSAGVAITQDAFGLALREIRAGFLATNTAQDLSELFHRLWTLIDQNRDHPTTAEAYVLLESIQSVRSQDNLAKHRISFESAASIFEDPDAISIYQTLGKNILVWKTLGRIGSQAGLFRKPIVLMVTHQTIGEARRLENGISSARKATSQERATYEASRKKAT